MGEHLDERRTAARQRLDALKGKLTQSTELAQERACVYATGSFARGEATTHSDLDLFIVGKTAPSESAPGEGPPKPVRLLKRLDEICIKAELIAATRALKILEFSGDGEYLEHYTVEQLTASLGSRQDDATNTLTARLLLLLESTPLIEENVYSEAITKVIGAYWRDYEDHQDRFMPAFLANDILRLWRTFCVNYEAYTKTDPPEKKAKRKLKNYKLKHSRLLTCYSALLFLLAKFRDQKTVSPDAAFEMVSLTPSQRLEWLKTARPDVAESVDELLAKYETFLEWTNASEHDLAKRFEDKKESSRRIGEAYAFGDKVFEVLEKVGTDQAGTKNQFYRLLVV